MNSSKTYHKFVILPLNVFFRLVILKQLIPYFIQEQCEAGNLQGHFEAHAMFVDLSGFTPLTEALMKQGSEGAEHLSLILNDIFEPMVRLVYSLGGFIPYFAGDAFTAIFPGNQGNSAANALVQTATRIRNLFHKTRGTSVGEFAIGVKIGIAQGNIEWGIVGHQHLSFYFRGEAIDGSATAQYLAMDREIVLHHSLKEELDHAGWKSAWLKEGYYLLETNPPESEETGPAPELPEMHPDTLTKFLPAAVLDFDPVGEFRHVVSVFISFRGVNDHDSFSQLARLVLDQVYNFSGYFKEVDFGDKGGVFVCFFGAPVTYENNDSRALEFILSLREELRLLQQSTQLQFRVGITAGLAFTGIVGGLERCQYAVVGNRVNLAARIMLNADWGEILSDQEIQRNKQFRFVKKGNIQYKGISVDIPTYRLTGRNLNEEQIYQGEMVGRDEELQTLSTFALHHLKQQNASVAYIYGEAGIGKSRLSFELEQNLLSHLPVRWFSCLSDQILRKPFNPFVYCLRNYFGQSPEQGMGENKRNFETRFDQLAESLRKSDNPQQELVLTELLRTQSVLAAVAGLFEAGSLWELLDAKGRYENILSALSNFFLAQTFLSPIVIELEDAHWLDEQSTAFLHELLRRLKQHPFLLLITSRYRDDGAKPELFENGFLKNLHIPVVETDLNILQPAAIESFAERRLAGKVHPDLLELLQRTSNGNPFYVEQMLAYFIESNLLEKEKGLWTIRDKSIKLSNSINAILTARIDRLSKLVRETVKAAAVIGREFEVPVLTEVMKSQEDFVRYNGNSQAVLKEQIQTAERWQIWRAMNELRYIFQHSLLREAVYDMQLRARLRELHRLIAEAIEKIYPDQIEERYVDLAFHYEQAGIRSKTNEYLLKAADHARRNFQNKQAIEFYDKLLLQREAIDSVAQVKIMLTKGSVLELIGEWGQCESLYRQALKKAHELDDAMLLGRTNNRLGNVLMLRGEYDEARLHLETAADYFENAGDKLGKSKVFGNLGNLFFRQGQYEDAKQYFTESISLSRSISETATDAQIVANLGLTYMNQGDYKEGIRCQQVQLDICEHQNDKQGMAILLTNMGIVYFEKGDYDAALDCYEKGLARSEALGNKLLISIAIGCIGSVYEKKGDYEQAMGNFVKDLELCEELGDKQGIAISLGLIGNLHSIRGDFENAVSYLKRNLKYCKKLNYQKGIAKARKDIASVYAMLHKNDKAIKYYNKAIKVCRQINNRLILTQCLIEKGRTLVEMGDYASANTLYLEGLEAAEQLGNAELLFQAVLLEAIVFHYENLHDIALKTLDDLRQQKLSRRNEADLYYEFYRLQPDNDNHRQKALNLYRELYQETPKFLFKKRLEELEMEKFG